MKTTALFASLLVGTLMALPATAQPGPGMGGMGSGMGPGMGQMGGGMGPGMGAGRADGMGPGMGPGMGMSGKGGGKRMDCAKTPDPKACEENRASHRAAHDKALEQCKDKVGPQHRECMRDAVVKAEDCTTARDPARCNDRKKAHEACQGKTGAEQRNCLREHRPAPDCAKAPNPERCKQRAEVMAACKDKPDPRACMREQRPGAKAPAPAAEKK